MNSQRELVEAAVARDNQRDVTPLRAPGDRRQRHRRAEDDVCMYCGAQVVDDGFLRMACPALLGMPLPTHARPGVGVSENRQGWRARLANIERLLVDCGEHKQITHEAVRDVGIALAEVRSIMDGE